jgi:hypothetical protein
MLKKLAPRSGSSVITAATSNVLAPSRSVEPTGASSDVISRSSIQTVPRFGPSSATASGAFGAGAIRSFPRKGYFSLTAFTPASWPRAASPSPVRAMLMNVVASARSRPRRPIASDTAGFHGWSETSTRSAPSSWCASRTSARLTRSAKNATLVTLATATTSAAARTRSSPPRQSRASMRSAWRITQRSFRRRAGLRARSARPDARRASP